jgi:hypothetical protein
MKLKVYADQSGKILATFRPTATKKGDPTGVRMHVKDAQEHEIEVSDDLLTPSSVHKLHTEYRVDVTGTAPKLVKGH